MREYLCKLIPLLRCPRCGAGSIVYDEERNLVVCSRCGARYRWVKDRILDLRTGTSSYRVALWKIFYDLCSALYDGLEHRLALRYGFSEDVLRIEIAKSTNLVRNNVVLEICAGTGNRSLRQTC